MSKHIRHSAIIDLVLENSELLKMEKEEGCSPTYCLGLQKDGYTNVCKGLEEILSNLTKEMV